jgi:hypothetical protein
MKLLKKHKDILQAVVKGKGIAKTKFIPREETIKEMDTVVELYMADILLFKSVSELEITGPKKQPRYKALQLSLHPKMDLNTLKKIIKKGVYESQNMGN